eukprot:scaffold221_cov120-Cylindrotheca_fusiformis.AAC.4
MSYGESQKRPSSQRRDDKGKDSPRNHRSLQSLITVIGSQLDFQRSPTIAPCILNSSSFLYSPIA